MPEGPSIVILKEEVQPFKGKKILAVSGNTKAGKERLLNQKIIDFKSWGKHFLICFDDFTLKIHLMLFGRYRINERKDTPARLSLIFKKGELNFYACSVRFIDEPLDTVYDWSADVMSDEWNPRKARKKLKEHPEMLACDALLNQQIVAGSGNIIKNEVLFRIRVHPESKISKLPPRKLGELIKEVRQYSFDFYKWKKAYVLRKHWLVHNKGICTRCNIKLIRKYLGKTDRRTFYCENCQVKYI